MTTNLSRIDRPRLLLSTTTVSLLLCVAAAAAQKEPDNVSLWKDPGEISSLDLFWANGSAERAPAGPFVFIEEDSNGTQPKVRVRDASGREWDVKFGEEVHAEIASSRLLWALGYQAEELYYVRDGTITGITLPGRARNHLDSAGAFSEARFSRRDDAIARIAERWTFENNPFVGTKELSGLAILMTMVNNWDIQGTRNNRILRVDGEARYLVSDVGSTFGKMGAFFVPHSKWNLEDFQKEEFIEKVDDGMLDLDYEGYAGIDKVPLEHARWFSALVSQLSDDQLRAALRAAGANEAEVTGFASRLREKIVELHDVVTMRQR